jgi:4-hydroxybutyrate dehydrogenase
MLPTLSYLNDVYFGEGKLACLPQVLEQYGLRRPLVVTDRQLRSLGFIEQTNLVDPVVFDDVETNPSESAASLAVAAYRRSGCDSLVAIGGGSPIDLAKIAALMVNHAGSLADYALLGGGPASVEHEVPPIVAVPTTAGSGSEVGRAALVTVADGRKLAFLSPKLLPVAAVCDPDLTTSMPAHLAAATGMDAISHCVEAILSPRHNPVAEGLAKEGLRRGSRAILRACSGDDSSAREEMLWCSLFGGLAFQKGLGAVHSLSHPLGRLEDLRLHHGTLNGLFLSTVITYNAVAAPDAIRIVSDVLGGADPATYFDDLLTRLGLPKRLAELGVSDADLASSAPLAVADHCTATNPRPMREHDALELYRSCL